MHNPDIDDLFDKDERESLLRGLVDSDLSISGFPKLNQLNSDVGSLVSPSELEEFRRNVDDNEESLESLLQDSSLASVMESQDWRQDRSAMNSEVDSNGDFAYDTNGEFYKRMVLQLQRDYQVPP
jgi:hypothetical protein